MGYNMGNNSLEVQNEKSVDVSILFLLMLSVSVCGQEGFEHFKEAESAYSWFTKYTGFSGNIDFESPPIKVNGKQYYKVDDSFNSINEVKEYLLTQFSPEIVDDLLSRELEGHKLFIEKDGELYYMLSFVGQNGYRIGERNYSIKEKTDTRIVYELEYNMVEYYSTDDKVIYDTVYLEYVHEKNEEGKFVFTKFTLPATKWHYKVDNPNTNDTVCFVVGVLAVSFIIVLLKRKMVSV